MNLGDPILVLFGIQPREVRHQWRLPNPAEYASALAQGLAIAESEVPSQYPVPREQALTPRTRSFFRDNWPDIVDSHRVGVSMAARDKACRAVAIVPPEAPYATRHFDQRDARIHQAAGRIEIHSTFPKFLISHSDRTAIDSDDSPALQDGSYTLIECPPLPATIDHCRGSYKLYKRATRFCRNYRMKAQKAVRDREIQEEATRDRENQERNFCLIS